MRQPVLVDLDGRSSGSRRRGRRGRPCTYTKAFCDRAVRDHARRRIGDTGPWCCDAHSPKLPKLHLAHRRRRAVERGPSPLIDAGRRRSRAASACQRGRRRRRPAARDGQHEATTRSDRRAKHAARCCTRGSRLGQRGRVDAALGLPAGAGRCYTVHERMPQLTVGSDEHKAAFLPRVRRHASTPTSPRDRALARARRADASSGCAASRSGARRSAASAPPRRASRAMADVEPRSDAARGDRDAGVRGGAARRAPREPAARTTRSRIPTTPAETPRDPEWGFLRMGYGECFDLVLRVRPLPASRPTPASSAPPLVRRSTASCRRRRATSSSSRTGRRIAVTSCTVGPEAVVPRRGASPASSLAGARPREDRAPAPRGADSRRRLHHAGARRDRARR